MEDSMKPVKLFPFTIVTCLAALLWVVEAAAGGRTPVEPLEEAVRGFDAFKKRHGEGWEVLWNDATGYGRFLSGPAIAPAEPPRSSTDFADMTRRLLVENRALFGVDPAQLSVKSVNHSPLSRVGTTDKVGVEMVQSVGGVEVYGASLVALYLPDGRLTAIDAQVLPIPEDLRATPRVSAARASDVASSEFKAAFGVPTDEVIPPRLVLYPFEGGGETVARLAWMVEARSSERESELSRHWMYVIAADDDAANVLDERNQVRAGDITGRVRGWATPGLGPHTKTAPSELFPLGHLRVTTLEEFPEKGLIYAETLPSGWFKFSGLTQSAGVTARLEGPLVNVNDKDGTDEFTVESLALGVPGTLTLNPNQTANATAEVNVFRWVDSFRSYILAVDPTYSLMNLTVKANVNRDEERCNAFYYTRSKIEFFLAGVTFGGWCVNTAYSTWIAHETGHWANDESGMHATDGMHEGAADVWALYVANTMNGNSDDPLFGRDYKGPGIHGRSGENLVQFCGDDNDGCHSHPLGGPHLEGQVLMGAFWKMRMRLKSTYGAQAGSDIANHLWIEWHKQFNQKKIRNEIVRQLLILDDDDGDLSNLTPHYYEINRAFRDQGFPGYVIPLPGPVPH
jgi:hypothetical protein